MTVWLLGSGVWLGLLREPEVDDGCGEGEDGGGDEAGGEPAEEVGCAREEGAEEATAGICHVVEADVDGDVI